jgi:hypothetical protein
MGRQGRRVETGFPDGRLPRPSAWECLMKSGVFRESRIAHGGSGRVSGRCLPYDVSAESFEETDTARNPHSRAGVATRSCVGTEWVP